MSTSERLKYERMWREFPDYRVNSPGESVLLKWLAIVKPKPGSSVIDFGCGPGRAATVMGLMGFRMTLVDIADNCLDPEVADLVDAGKLAFTCMDFTETGHLLPHADHGYCCDVMEHMPPDRVDAAIAQIIGKVRDAFFLVSLSEDNFGEEIGEDLHLTVQPFTWWRDKFREHGTLFDARDLIANAMFRVRR